MHTKALERQGTLTRRHPIRTAHDKNGALVKIENAVAGERYKGATQDHEGCLLYPVSRQRRQSSYAHLPGTGRAQAHSQGQTAGHREACLSWHRFFERLLSKCSVCRLFGLEKIEHICPAVCASGPSAEFGSPMYGEIVWVCDVCMKIHMWNLLHESAASVQRERELPGSSLRPDIVILDKDDRPLSLIEFKGSHLNPEIKEVASQRDFPLFVVDVEREKEAFKLHLQNPQRGTWQAMEDAYGILESESAARINRRMDELNYQYAESVGKEKDGVSATFAPIPDRNGNLADVHFHATGRSASLPIPSLGPYLVASWSSLKCDSQRRWLVHSNA